MTENITHIVSLNAGKNSIPNLLLLRIQCTICLKTKIDIFVFFWNREALILKESVMKQKFSKNKLIFSNHVYLNLLQFNEFVSFLRSAHQLSWPFARSTKHSNKCRATCENEFPKEIYLLARDVQTWTWTPRSHVHSRTWLKSSSCFTPIFSSWTWVNVAHYLAYVHVHFKFISVHI